MSRTPIITVSTGKGGAGKTTTTITLADYWASTGYKIGLLNTDPNKSLTRWYEKGVSKGYFENILFKEELQEKNIISAAKELCKEVDILLIDVAGIASVSLLKAAGIADLVIIPAQPNEDDFLEAINTKEIVKEAEELTGRKISCKTILTRSKAGTRVLEHVASQLEKRKFPLFKTIFYDRTIFPKARLMGGTPISYGNDVEAKKEIANFAQEVAEMIGKCSSTDKKNSKTKAKAA